MEKKGERKERVREREREEAKGGRDDGRGS